MNNKDNIIQAVKTCLIQGNAKNLSDDEIERCMRGRVSESALILYAKEFRTDGILGDENVYRSNSFR